MDEETLNELDTDLMTQVCGFAAHKAQNGVYLAQMYSKSLGAPVLLLVAFGDQALAVQQILMKAAVPDAGSLIERVSNNGNGGF